MRAQDATIQGLGLSQEQGKEKVALCPCWGRKAPLPGGSTSARKLGVPGPHLQGFAGTLAAGLHRRGSQAQAQLRCQVTLRLSRSAPSLMPHTRGMWGTLTCPPEQRGQTPRAGQTQPCPGLSGMSKLCPRTLPQTTPPSTPPSARRPDSAGLHAPGLGLDCERVAPVLLLQANQHIVEVLVELQGDSKQVGRASGATKHLCLPSNIPAPPHT